MLTIGWTPTLAMKIGSSTMKGKSMIKVTEVQDKDTTRLYHLDGPRLDTVASFWDYLVETRQINGYEIEEVA
jgi:hypothetical protein